MAWVVKNHKAMGYICIIIWPYSLSTIYNMDYIAAIIFSRSRYLHRHTNGNKLTDIISKSTPKYFRIWQDVGIKNVALSDFKI